MLQYRAQFSSRVKTSLRGGKSDFVSCYRSDFTWMGMWISLSLGNYHPQITCQRPFDYIVFLDSTLDYRDCQ